jgi:hypothetical protein
MIKNSIIFVTLLLMSNAILRAQGTTPNCTPNSVYVQQHDGIGKNPFDPTQLSAAAIELAQVFPQPYCSAFKVYDYGFTPISQYTKGGYAADFELMKLQCSGADREQPYLLFAREVNEVGIVTKIWVDVKLPKSKNGNFDCLKEMNRSLFKIRVEKAVEEAMGLNKDNPLVISAEIMGMAKLKEIVVKMVDGCYCGGRGEGCEKDNMTADEIFKYLLEHDFVPIPCKIIANSTSTTTNPLGTFDVKVTDNANLTVIDPYYNQPIMLFKHSVELVMVMKKENNEEGEAFITKNENFADFSFQGIETKFNTSINKNDIWWHIWDNPNKDEDDYFLINRKDVNLATATAAKNGGRSIDKCNPDWEICPCYDFERQGDKSGIFYVFGTGEKQTWGYHNNWDDKCTTFKPSLIENINFLGQKLSNEHHISDLVNKCFDWSAYNKWDNNVNDRAKAAKDLVNYVIENITPFEKLNKNLPITLIGYSHGGNVAIQAAPKLFEKLGKKINLITISTPTSNFTTLEQFAPLAPKTAHQRYVENPNHPKNAEAINSHYHLWCKSDKVVQGSNILEGSHQVYYNCPRTRNIEIIDDGCVTSYSFFHTIGDTHGFIHNGKGSDNKEGCLIPQITEMLKNNTLIRQQ